nr:hypothetical protein [Vicinamibacterales bacterium]
REGRVGRSVLTCALEPPTRHLTPNAADGPASSHTGRRAIGVGASGAGAGALTPLNADERDLLASLVSRSDPLFARV